MKTYVVGHINPDTDSVVSAIVYAMLKKKLKEDEKFIPAVAGDINKETSYVLKKFNVNEPSIVINENKNVVLVDHNEPSQISGNINNEEIVAIIDHHKLGGLSTSTPILVITEPVGSTSTIIAKIAFQNNIKINTQEASLLVSGIISDTLKFSSPTTTEIDKKTLKELNEIAKIDIDELAQEMFKAKSDLAGITDKELISKDYKNFNIKGKKVGVGVFETVDPKPALERAEDIKKELVQKKNNEKLDYLIFAVIGIVNKKAYFMTPAPEDEQLLTKALNIKKEGNYLVAPGIVSRKKQIIPALEKNS